MTRVWTGATMAIALSCAAVVAAQSGTSGQSTKSQSESSKNPITVVGCLQPADHTSGTSGTSGTATSGSTSRGGQYILTNATVGSSSGSYGSTGGTTSGTSGSTTSGTAGSGTTGSASGSGSTYVLEGKTDELAKHSGHKVEVTGTLSSDMSHGSRTGTGTGTSGTGTAGSGTSASGSPDLSMAPHLRVSSVRMISSDCSSSSR